MTRLPDEHLHVAGTAYRLDGFPLEDHPAMPAIRSRQPSRPCPIKGYLATWALLDDQLCLTGLDAREESPLARLFPHAAMPLPAAWFSGMLRARRGAARITGYPPRRIGDDELFMEIRAGRVLRRWLLDLRGVPDQTDDELRLSLPRCLWSARLREGAPDASGT